jgi:hypothetical protein
MLSPGISNREIDATFSVQSVTSNASASVGVFRWGPIDTPIAVNNESALARLFLTPDSATKQSYQSVNNFLFYSSPIWVTRITGAAARNAVPTGETAQLIKNTDAYDVATLTGISFIARYAGTAGNAITVSAADSTGFSGWDYEDQFEYAPETGEFNLVVVDTTGAITGSAGTILEKYELLSKTVGAKKDDGTSAFVKDVLRASSNYVLVGDLSEIVFDETGSEGVYEVSLQGGVDDYTSLAYEDAVELLSNEEKFNFINCFSAIDNTDIKKALVDMAASRQDCVAFVDPSRASVSGDDETILTNVQTYFETTLNKFTSYNFIVDNWKLVNNKYDRSEVWIGCASDAAGIHCRRFIEGEGWDSPAGYSKGQIKNAIKLAWSARKSFRDILYPKNINSIVSIAGEGTFLFGDKTGLRRPSLFNRIGVRTLFIILRKAISNSAKYQLFEQNDFISRSIFRNGADQYLAGVQARRGISDYRVICDERNNTNIGPNDFVGDIFVKPISSINYVQLNFVSVDQNVSFEEIEGITLSE